MQRFEGTPVIGVVYELECPAHGMELFEIIEITYTTTSRRTGGFVTMRKVRETLGEEVHTYLQTLTAP